MKLVFCFLILLTTNVMANENLAIFAVGKASLEKDKIVVGHPKYDGKFSYKFKTLALDMSELFANDFSFYRKNFNVERGFKSKTKFFGLTSPNYDVLKQEGTSYFIHTENKVSGKSLEVTAALYKVKTGEKVLERKRVVNSGNYRSIGHQMANEMYRQIFGKESIFTSKIVFVSDKPSYQGNLIKELYIMDFDGSNIQRLTNHRQTVVGPSISPDKTKVLYSLIHKRKGKRNVDLFLLDLKTNRTKMISSRRGINSGAIFTPDGSKILLTLTISGNADIFEMDLKTRRLRKVTNHFADDVDPSMTRDGQLMAFLSGRPGPAMIYLADPAGLEKKVKRVSFVGKFNATPRFSPDGSEMVFSSWMDKGFDLFRMSRSGTGLVRLTKDFGSNESPTYSNDGEFIAFSSQRVLSRTKATHNIYIMDRDGDILGAITKRAGNCISPRWSK